MKTIKLYKKYKRLDDGGIPPNEKFAQSVGYGNSAIQVANMGNQLLGEQGNEFGVKSNTGAVLGGGLQGAAMGAGVGSMFGPIGTIAGGAIGGTIGIIKSNQSNNEAKRREEDYKNQQKQLFLQNQQNSFNQVLNNGFQVQGNMNAQKYAKNGGLLSIMYKNGGNVQQLSKTNVQFNGNSHENGGIKEPLVNGVKLDNTEVEGKESMSTSNGQKFVFSENLGFAQQHKPLAKAMGKIEKKLKSNPNDPISKRTLNTLKDREEQLKVKQEETKLALGLENNLGEMRLGGAIKRKDGVYIDREGVMKYPLKNGGLAKYPNGGIPDYTLEGALNTYNTNLNKQKWMNDEGASLKEDGVWGPKSEAAYNAGWMDPSGRGVLAGQSDLNSRQSMNPNNYKNLPSAHFLGGSNVNPSSNVKNSSVGGPSSLESLPGKGATGTSTESSRVNWGNVAGKIIPYVGVASNYMLNEKARKMTTPKEALPDYVKYKPVDYSASKIEADQQRRQLNKSLTQNVTNSAVAAALKAKNLGTTIGAKNLINQEETNVNTEGVNKINLINNQIQQRRNQIDVENRDRDYNKEQRYLTQKGEIVNNFSDIYQKQGRDQRLEGLENRKIDVLSKYDMNRGVHEREIIVPSIVDKQSRGQSLSKQEQEFLDKNPDLFKRNGGVIKKTNKLYSKSKK